MKTDDWLRSVSKRLTLPHGEVKRKRRCKTKNKTSFALLSFSPGTLWNTELPWHWGP